MPPAIELIDINKSFGDVHANRDVNLSVARGTIHGIVGENGAGKSTLMSILYGFYEADSGEIRVNGTAGGHPLARPMRSPPASAWCISTSCWSRPLTVVENVMLGAEGGVFLRSGAAQGPRRAGAAGAGLRPRDRPRCHRRRPVGRAAAARRDPEGALSRRGHPDPRRADRRADAAGGGCPVRTAARPEGAGQDGHPDHPQAARDHGGHGPRLGDAARRDGGDRARRTRPRRRSSPS